MEKQSIAKLPIICHDINYVVRKLMIPNSYAAQQAEGVSAPDNLAHGCGLHYLIFCSSRQLSNMKVTSKKLKLRSEKGQTMGFATLLTSSGLTPGKRNSLIPGAPPG